MHGDSDFDDAALSDMVSNLLADTYETCFDTSRPQEPRSASPAVSTVRGRRRSTCACCAESATPCVRDSSRSTSVPSNCAPTRNGAMGDYLKHHSTEGDTVMASVEDYPYFLDELKNLNMLVTRAATDEEYANSVEKLYMSFQQLNRAFNTDEENVREQLDRINGMLKGQQFGPRRQALAPRGLPPDRPAVQILVGPHHVETRRLDTQRAQQSHGDAQGVRRLRKRSSAGSRRNSARSATRTASRNTVRATSIHACAARSTRSCTITICHDERTAAPPAASPAARCRNSPRSSTARP